MSDIVESCFWSEEAITLCVWNACFSSSSCIRWSILSLLVQRLTLSEHPVFHDSVCCFWTKNHRKKTGGICDYCYWMVSISYSLGSTDFMLCLLKGLDEIWKVNLIRQGLRWTQSTNYSPDKWMVTVVCNIVWNTDLFGILSDNHSQAGRHQSHIIRFLPCTISNNLHLSGVFI